MRRDEQFVAHALVEHLGGPSVVAAFDGPDPPDLFLKFGGQRVAVEVTRLSQFTIASDGTLGTRATADAFGLRLLNDLDSELGALVPDELSLLVGLWVSTNSIGDGWDIAWQ